MNMKAAQFAVYAGGQVGRTEGEPPGREFQECWFALARERWASLVLLPANRGTSVGTVATSLAAVGTRLGETPVTAIVAESLDYGAARTLAELQPKLQGESPWVGPVELTTKAVGAASDGSVVVAPRMASDSRIVATPMARVIIALQPVVEEPLGVAIAQSADAVVLCIEMGRSSIASARKTLRLVGPSQVLGALLIR